MKKRYAALLPVLLLPFLVSNSPAPGPYTTDVELELSSSEDGTLTISNPSEYLIADMYIDISAPNSIDFDFLGVEVMGYNSMSYRNGYFLLPGGSLTIEVSSSVMDTYPLDLWTITGEGIGSSYLVKDALDIESATPGEGTVDIEGTITNTSSSYRGYLALCYVETDKGTYGSAFYANTRKEKTESFSATIAVPEGYENAEISSYLILNNSYYSDNYDGIYIEDGETIALIVIICVCALLLIGGITAAVVIQLKDKKKAD